MNILFIGLLLLGVNSVALASTLSLLEHSKSSMNYVSLTFNVIGILIACAIIVRGLR